MGLTIDDLLAKEEIREVIFRYARGIDRMEEPDGLPDIAPFDRQDSALLSILGQADALLIRDVEAPACHAGDTVSYLPL